MTSELEKSITAAQAPVVLSDEPRLSSAALATILRLGSATTTTSASTTVTSFHPEYTHQCVGPSETFRGHQPFSEVLQKALQQQQQQQQQQSDENGNHKAVLHKSHLSHAEATYECNIHVTLAPSCRSCRVDLQRRSIAPVDQDTENGEIAKDNLSPPVKKVKFNSALPQPVGEIVAPLSDKEIQQAIAKALPAIRHLSSTSVSAKETTSSTSTTKTTTTRDNPEDEDYLTEPIGTVVLEYDLVPKQQQQQHKRVNDRDTNASAPSEQANSETNDTHQHFVLCLASPAVDPAAAAYHTEVQRLALWFIENADDVDVADDQTGGYWKVLYIFQKHPYNQPKDPAPSSATTTYSYRYSLVGYVTLFHFHAPFHKPTPGIVVRICQALVLPPFQGQGHGKRALQAVYHSVMHQRALQEPAQSDPVVQVNVEDPAPGFVALRNKVDLQFLMDHPEWWPATHRSGSIIDPVYFTALPDSVAEEISARAKITSRQVQIVNELVKLRNLLQLQGRCSGDLLASFGAYCPPNDVESNHEELQTRFRLMVKKRLNRESREEMNAYPTKEEKKAFLGKLFDEEHQSYLALLLAKKASN